MFRTLLLAMLVVPGSALAQDKPAEASAPAPANFEMTTGTFEMFRLVPGQTEAFLRSIAEWEKVSIAGGQQPSQVFLHAGGEGWDVMLYKPSRPKTTPEQSAAMKAKTRELGLPSGALFFLDVRNHIADHTHFEVSGPTTATEWLKELDRQRAEAQARK